MCDSASLLSASFDTIARTLYDKGYAFALYRLPHQTEPVCVIDTAEQATWVKSPSELTTQSGFVLAPFCFPSQPARLVKADHLFFDSQEALTFVHTLPARTRPQSKVITISREEDDFDNYAKAFERFMAVLTVGRFQKLVLSRSSWTALPKDLTPGMLFRRACAAHPHAAVTLTWTAETGLWLGATPEILVTQTQAQCQTMALAGTMPCDDPAPWSAKNQHEQGLVANMILDVLKRHAQSIDEEGPYTVTAGPVKHLRTDFHFTLRARHTLGHVVEALHPTPAVCGLPMPEAATFIEEAEGRHRELYAGFLGPVQIQDSTALFVNLRCLTLYPEQSLVRLHAGGGLLPASQLQSEWTETNIKMQTLRRLFE